MKAHDYIVYVYHGTKKITSHRVTADNTTEARAMVKRNIRYSVAVV